MPRSLDIDSGTTKFDLTLDLWDGGDGIAGRLEYNTDLFETDTIQRMAGHYRTLLEGAVANPDARLTQIPMLTVHERRQLLVTWNATRRETPGEPCLHRLFEAQV